ncbi:hypothetical protein BHM03_00051467 [Ensete ventricosum]|nr:hypothetical protein BHM03_00051467 [Ensete ventricosum]
MLLPHLISFLLISLLRLSTAAAPSAYEVLRSHGLPMGLLPKGVREFEVDGGGRFRARLDAPCTAKFESEVRYNATLAGTISPGQIAALSGVSAQDLFLWFPVLAIRLDDNASGIIHFDVGVVDKRLPLSLFEFPPDCTPLSSSPQKFSFPHRENPVIIAVHGARLLSGILSNSSQRQRRHWPCKTRSPQASDPVRHLIGPSGGKSSVAATRTTKALYEMMLRRGLVLKSRRADGSASAKACAGAEEGIEGDEVHYEDVKERGR